MSPSSESTSMEARYEQEVNGRDPSTIIDLILDNCSASAITGLGDDLTNLQSLSIINAGLETLEGLPKLPNLVKLDLSNNQLCEGLEVIVSNCPELLHLNLSGNSFETVDALKCLAGTMVAEIDIFSNPLSTEEAHRSKLFALLDNLQILDGCDVNGDEIEDEPDENSVAGEDSEDDAITDEEDLGSDEDDGEEGPGLSYLDKSQFSDDDEDEDFDPESKKGKKRAAAGADGEDEPPSKKDA